MDSKEIILYLINIILLIGFLSMNYNIVLGILFIISSIIYVYYIKSINKDFKILLSLYLMIILGVLVFHFNFNITLILLFLISLVIFLFYIKIDDKNNKYNNLKLAITFILIIILGIILFLGMIFVLTGTNLFI